MEQAHIFSGGIRRLAIATGIASALALFPILFLLYPPLLIAGGIIQPRSPATGKWFVWAGAASLWVVVIVYDVMIFQDLWRQTKVPEYMELAFSATTVLLIWCSVELPADALRRMRDRHFYIIGFSLGHPGQKPWWKLVGRKDRYKTTEEARDVLQREMERQD
jgi:hypothetical protein